MISVIAAIALGIFNIFLTLHLNGENATRNTAETIIQHKLSIQRAVCGKNSNSTQCHEINEVVTRLMDAFSSKNYEYILDSEEPVYKYTSVMGPSANVTPILCISENGNPPVCMELDSFDWNTDR